MHLTHIYYRYILRAPFQRVVDLHEHNIYIYIATAISCYTIVLCEIATIVFWKVSFSCLRSEHLMLFLLVGRIIYFIDWTPAQTYSCDALWV